MNAALATSAPGTTTTDVVAVPVNPQVNLLPPDVAAARGLRTVQRWTVLSILAALLVVGLLYAVSMFQLVDARGELDAAQLRGTQLQGQIAEYAEVPQVLNELERAEQARTLAASTEVLWRPQLDALRAALPAGATVRTLTVAGATPVVPAIAPVDPLQPQGYGQIAFTASTATVPDSTAWVDALRAVPGLADPRIQSVVAETGDAGVTYTVTGVVQYDEKALSGRFQTTEGDE